MTREEVGEFVGDRCGCGECTVVKAGDHLDAKAGSVVKAYLHAGGEGIYVFLPRHFVYTDSSEVVLSFCPNCGGYCYPATGQVILVDAESLEARAE